MSIESIFQILQVVLGIGLVIFVHELGHFLAARWCRVRVEVFSIGMGPRLFSRMRGTTRYQLAMIPIGGYVRMAGEDRRMDGLPPEPDDLNAKSVGARFFIYSGGVIMNVLFGLVVFPLIFTLGVPLTRPVLGEPAPGGPAWEAGLTAGTEVISVNGRGVFDYPHIPTAIALGDTDGAEIVYLDEAGAEKKVTVVPRYHETGGFYTIDISPPYQRGPRNGEVLHVVEGSPMAAAGVKSGEELLAIVGAPEGLSITQQFLHVANGEAIRFRIGDIDGTSERVVTVEPNETALQPARIGVRPPYNLVAGLRGEALRARALNEGDFLLSVFGQPLYRAGDLRAALLDAVDSAAALPVEVPFEAQRNGEVFSDSFLIDSREAAIALDEDLALELNVHSSRIVAFEGEPAALAGVLDGDLVRRVSGGDSANWDDTRTLIVGQIQQDEPVVLEVERMAAGVPRIKRIEIAPVAPPGFDYGLQFVEDVYEFRAESLVEAVEAGAICSWRFAEDVFLTFKRMMTSEVSAKNVGGPISIGILSHSFAESGPTKLFFFLCILSINLAIINVLPIPLLDGGHLTFLLIEKIKGSPVSERVLVYSQVVGLVLILSLMVYITYNDVVRWFLPPA